MQLQRFDEVDDFNQAAAPFLIQQEAQNNLPLSLIGNLQRGAFYDEPPYMAVVRDEHDQVIAAALRTPPHNLILAQTASHEAIELLAQDTAKLYPTLKGVNGTKANSQAFAEIWTRLTGQTAAITMNERIYELTQVIPVYNVAGSARKATLDDMALLRQWLYEFRVEAFGEGDEEMVAHNLQNRLENGIGAYYLWEVDGKAVCVVGHTVFTPNGVRIGPVYTPPAERGKGYGSACTAAVSQLLLDAGRTFCFLYTDLTNPTSNHIYQTIGYVPVCDVDEYTFS